MVKKNISRFLFLILSSFISMISVAQDRSVEMADRMRSNGKIYIVVAVCLTILVGLFLYVAMLDRKINRIEKRNVE